VILLNTTQKVKGIRNEKIRSFIYIKKSKTILKI